MTGDDIRGPMRKLADSIIVCYRRGMVLMGAVDTRQAWPTVTAHQPLSKSAEAIHIISASQWYGYPASRVIIPSITTILPMTHAIPVPSHNARLSVTTQIQTRQPYILWTLQQMSIISYHTYTTQQLCHDRLVAHGLSTQASFAVNLA